MRLFMLTPKGGCVSVLMFLFLKKLVVKPPQEFITSHDCDVHYIFPVQLLSHDRCWGKMLNQFLEFFEIINVVIFFQKCVPLLIHF